MLDKEKIKKRLESEINVLLEEMKSMGKMDLDTKGWEAVPEPSTNESDQNDMADRFEDYESKSSMLSVLHDRLNNLQEALGNINKSSFGKCEVCKKDIENTRIEANPAATTCKKHL